MKHLIVLAALFAPSLVHADTESVQSAVAPTTASSTYVAGGAMLGADHAVVTAVSLDAGYQLRGSLWLHGMVAKGTAAGVDENTYGGDYVTGRIGVEERGCIVSALCAVAGLDVGYRHVDYMAEDGNMNASGMVVVPRIGLDVGGSHVRFRPGIEGIVDGTNTIAGLDGVDLTAAVAYRW